MEFADIYRELTRDFQSRPGKNYRIYDYSGETYSGDFEQFFQFVMQSKKDRFKGLIADPFYFYFIDLDENDAYAIRQLNGCNVIGVSKGLFKNLIYACESHAPRLIELAIAQGVNMDVLHGARLDQFMYIVARYFIHYHELAHIIQFTKLNQYRNENRAPALNAPFVLMDHVKERDADICGANYSAEHIMDNWKDLPLNLKNRAALETLITFGIVGIYQLFDLLSNGLKQDLYFFKTDHPHTINRISIIMEIMIQKVSSDSKIQLDSVKIIRNVLQVLRSLNMDESAAKFLWTMARNPLEIDLYRYTLETEHKKHNWLAGPQLTKTVRFRAKKMRR